MYNPKSETYVKTFKGVLYQSRYIGHGFYLCSSYKLNAVLVKYTDKSDVFVNSLSFMLTNMTTEKEWRNPGIRYRGYVTAGTHDIFYIKVTTEKGIYFGIFNDAVLWIVNTSLRRSTTVVWYITVIFQLRLLELFFTRYLN